MNCIIKFFLENIPRPTDLSMASQQFLAKYGLQSESQPLQLSQPIRKPETPQPRMPSSNQNQCYSPVNYQTSPQSSVTNIRPPVTKPLHTRPQLLLHPSNTGPQLHPRPPPTSHPRNGPLVVPHPNMNGPHPIPHQNNLPLPVPHPSNGPGVNQPFERLLDISAIRQQSKLL